MSPNELFEVMRGSNAQIATLFAEVITINFAMVVAVYYFLNRANVRLKLLAFLFYAIGMLLFMGLMLLETNVRRGALEALTAMPQDQLALPVRKLVAASNSPVGELTSLFANIAYWLLWAGVAYLLFIWRRDETPAGAQKQKEGKKDEQG